jgi:hypothetical protein
MTTNKSQSRDGIAISGLNITGDKNPVNVTLTVVGNDTALAKLVAKAEREERVEQRKLFIIILFIVALGLSAVGRKTSEIGTDVAPAIANFAERNTSANSAGPAPLPVPHGPWRPLNPGEWTPTEAELAKLPK